MKTSQSTVLARAGAARAFPKAMRRGVDNRQIDSLMRLMRRESGKAVRFEVAAARGSKVYVAGTFNHWNPNTHPLHHHPEDGIFRATLHLPAGTHEYKFVVDGVWHLDAKCPNWVLNEHGTLNSVVRV